MICARSLFIMSVVKPGTGLCSQMPPSASNRLPSAVIAAPSLPVLHCEITVTLGFAAWARDYMGCGKQCGGSGEHGAAADVGHWCDPSLWV